MPMVEVETNIAGYTVGVFKPDMPRISSDLLDCAIYLYPSELDARHGEKIGGSGFLFPLAYSATCPVRGMHIYAVTNAHVAVLPPAARVIRLRRRDGEPVIIDPGADAWLPHPGGDDLAVCQLKLKYADAFRLITPRFPARPDRSGIDEFGETLGRDVVMVGRFIGHDGREKNTPSLRFGNVAALPVEPIRHPVFDTDQESYLVEMRSLPGFSGSPVFVLPDPWEQVQVNPTKQILADQRGEKGYLIPDFPRPIRDPRDIALLGVDWCHLRHPPERLVRADGKPAANQDLYIRTHSGMAGVIPWWRLWDWLKSPDLDRARKRIEDEAEQSAKNSPAMPD